MERAQVSGSDGPYWSLGFEVWYYVAFGAFLFAPGRWRWLAAAGVLVFIGPKVAVMFPIWVLGVALFHISRRQRFGRKAGWAMLVVPVLLLALYQWAPHSPQQAFTSFDWSAERLWSMGQDWLIGSLFAIHLLGFITVSDSFAAVLERYSRPIRWVAGATFSLYLVHLPLMHLLAAYSPWPKSSLANVLLLLLATPLACLAFAEVSERRKTMWRRVFLAILPDRRHAPAGD